MKEVIKLPCRDEDIREQVIKHWDEQIPKTDKNVEAEIAEICKIYREGVKTLEQYGMLSLADEEVVWQGFVKHVFEEDTSILDFLKE